MNENETKIFIPKHCQEYYAVDCFNIFEGNIIRVMIWIGSKQNKADLKDKNVFRTYAEAFDFEINHSL